MNRILVILFHGCSSGIKQNTHWCLILLHFSSNILLSLFSIIFEVVDKSGRSMSNQYFYRNCLFTYMFLSAQATEVLSLPSLNLLLRLTPTLDTLPLSLSSCRVWITSHIQRARPTPGIEVLWRKRADQSVQISPLLLPWWPPQNTGIPAAVLCLRMWLWESGDTW